MVLYEYVQLFDKKINIIQTLKEDGTILDPDSRILGSGESCWGTRGLGEVKVCCHLQQVRGTRGSNKMSMGK